MYVCMFELGWVKGLVGCNWINFGGFDVASALRHYQVLAKLDQTFNQISRHVALNAKQTNVRKLT